MRVPRSSNILLSLTVLAIIIYGSILLIILALCLGVRSDQQFSYLAEAFLHGKTHFLSLSPYPMSDVVVWHGAAYWSSAPLPAIVLMPFVALFTSFHAMFYQGYLQAVLILAVVYVVLRLARKLGYSRDDSIILTAGFVFGSVFIGVAANSVSWHLAQVMTTLFLFLAFLEFYSRKRWWLLGVLCALLVLTRASAAPVVLFFIFQIFYHQKRITAQQRRQLLALAGPMIIAVGIVLWYNFTRFHDPFQAGYAYPASPVKAVVQAQKYGVVSLVHVPGNIFSALLSAPLPVYRDTVSHVLKFPYIQNNPWGMSIFFTSPYLLRLFSMKRSAFNAQTAWLFITVLVSAAMVFTFYGIGYVQFGYRYALDFLPSLFVLFMIAYRKTRPSLSMPMKVVLLSSGIINFYLLLPYFHLGIFRT